MKLRVLIVEDNETDALLLVRELRRAGYDLTHERVDSPEALEIALDRRPWDLVVSDYQMPGFSGLKALEIVKAKELDIPFIILSGVIMEEMAVVAMRKGAHDCIMKDNLARLFPAVERELKDAEIRRERRRAEIELRESEEKYRKLYEESKKAEELYRSLLNSSPDAIVISDLQGKFIYLSPSFTQTFGFTLEEIRDGNVPFVPVSEKRDLIAKIHDLVENGIPFKGIEMKRYRKDGRLLEVSISASRYNDHEGNPAGVLTIFRDITETKKLETHLRQAQKMEAIGTLAGGIAHDFNNILGAIIGYTEISLRFVKAPSNLSRNLEQILNASVRAGDLVRQILTFSRQTEQALVPVQVSNVVKDALILLRATLPSTVEIRQNTQSEATVMADPTQIHQVLMNLCTNASYAMREKGGILTVDLEQVDLNEAISAKTAQMNQGEYLRISVSDSGHGMDRETQDRIFDPFFTTKEKGEGTGMGLSVVHGIVENHGGTITVYSEPGKGSVFRVYLPVLEPKGESSPIRSAVLPLPVGHENILFVDDEAALVELGQEMLEHLGYQVTGLTSSLEALELFQSDPDRFDLVITDLTMPHLTGVSLARELFKTRPDIPIILCTGYSRQISQEQIQLLGIKHFIMKPMLIREVAQGIRAALDNRTSSQTQEYGHKPSPSRKVLLADDDAITRTLLSNLLKEKGHTVVLAENGKKAVEQFDRNDFDLILMDLNMPELNGLEASRVIRQKEKPLNKRVPIIAITGQGRIEDQERCMKNGMDGCLAKPITQNSFFRTIGRFLGDAPDRSPIPDGPLAPTPEDHVFDRDALMANVVGDTELFKDLVHLFLENLPDQMSAIQKAIDLKDDRTLAQAAHLLAGRCTSLHAQTTAEAASRLENIGRTGDLSGAEEAFAVLVKEAERLESALKTPL